MVEQSLNHKTLAKKIKFKIKKNLPKFKKMKKIFYILSIILILSLVACNFIDTTAKNTGITAPNVSKSNGSDVISVIPTTLATSTYINIFRYDETNTYNVGQIVKTSDYTTTGEVHFVDYYSSGDKKYSYFARYKTSSGYVVSKSSGLFSGGPASGTDNEKAMQVDTTDGNATVTVYYDSDAYVLKVKKSELKIPTTYKKDNNVDADSVFTPMIAINNGIKTQLFEMEEKTIKENVSGTDTDVVYWYFDMRTYLPDSFFDKELTLDGIVGQEVEEGTNSSETDAAVLYYVYFWTKPLESSLLTINYSNSEVNTIIVTKTSKSENVYDYTSYTAESSS